MKPTALTAIVTPMTGYLVTRFGRRRVMLVCVSGFTFATWLCGQADSLETANVGREPALRPVLEQLEAQRRAGWRAAGPPGL